MSEDQFECELPRHNSTSDEIRAILDNTRIVAIIGLSTYKDKPSYRVASYLQSVGYRILPIHPKADEILGEKVYRNLEEIPANLTVDIVDIFRRPDAVFPHVQEAIAVGAKVVWLQEGIVNNAAADLAIESGLSVVQNLCILKEHKSL
ncbi:MAG: CoA-binding protein [bacterium]|nr:CoA-binding protein [bacterium]